MLVTVERQGFAVLLKIFCGQCWSKVAVCVNMRSKQTYPTSCIADAEYQKMQSMSKEEKEQAAAKAAAEKALAAKAKAAREKAEATSDVDEMLGELGSGKSAPKTHTSTSSGGASMAEISAYTAQVSGMIRSKLPCSYSHETRWKINRD